MQAGMHVMHAALASAASNPDQNRSSKPNTIAGSSCGIQGRSKTQQTKKLLPHNAD